MRHHNQNRKFGRERNARRALVKSLARSLIIHGKVRTTISKAKELRPVVERLITNGRSDSLASRRLLISKTGDPLIASKLIGTLGPKYKNRSGGYTRIIKVGARESDGSQMAVIEFV
jgi:large subunit ribosomal protein L17